MLRYNASIIAALCLFVTPVRAETQDAEKQIELAIAARNAGEFGRAIDLLEALDVQTPNDPDRKSVV